MTSRFHNYVMTSELRRMRAMFADGMTVNAIAVTLKRSPTTVSTHLAPEIAARFVVAQRLRSGREARRIERLFAACNQALADASGRLFNDRSVSP